MSFPTLPPTLLLVDDDATARFLLRRQVERHWPGVRVLEAENGAQGLALVQAHCEATKDPSSLLVLLDLKMPVLDGFGFISRLEHLPNDCQQATAVVVSSTSTYSPDLSRVQALGYEWAPKPVGYERLAQLLRQYLPAALEAEAGA